MGADGIIARISAICDAFECYGSRRVGAALGQQGVIVNGKKLRRLMREHDLQLKRRRRYVVTADSDHAGPIYPDLVKDVIPGGFVYLAVILDAWSRKVVGYAISRCMTKAGVDVCGQHQTCDRLAPSRSGPSDTRLI